MWPSRLKEGLVDDARRARRASAFNRNHRVCDRLDCRFFLPRTDTHDAPREPWQPRSSCYFRPRTESLSIFITTSIDGSRPNTMKADPLTLSSIGDRLETWSRNPLHPTLLPFGVLALIHALRVSHATRQVAGSHRNRLGLWQSFLLNQILMFAGVIVSGMLLGIPSPLLTAWPVVVLYGGMHVVADITPAGKMLLDAQEHETVGAVLVYLPQREEMHGRTQLTLTTNSITR